MLEGFKHMFGGDESKEAETPVKPAHHYDDADRFTTGRTAEGVTDDISTVQESGAIRFDRIKVGIAEVLTEAGIPPQDALGRQDFFAEKLVEKNILSAEDIRFPGILEEIVKAAREVSLEGIQNVGRSKNWEKRA